jgi:hypothetical protein
MPIPIPAPIAATATPIHTASEWVTPAMGVLDWAVGVVVAANKAQIVILHRKLPGCAFMRSLISNLHTLEGPEGE